MMAEDWKPMLQRTCRRHGRLPDAYLDHRTGSLRHTSAHWFTGTKSIASRSATSDGDGIRLTTSEQRTRPNRISNDWYRDERRPTGDLFMWFVGCVSESGSPATDGQHCFGHAQSSNPRSGLDYRKIPLLSSSATRSCRMLRILLLGYTQHDCDLKRTRHWSPE